MNQRLTRARRLTRKEEFDRVFAYGRKISQWGINAWITPATCPRLGCAISSKYGNNARRNQFKRRARAAFRELYNQLPPMDVVISASAQKGWITYHDIVAFFQYIIANEQAGNQTGTD
ncbi:MAG: ribonuclease P protein component [Candidatus Neomarinimicrobiota bacterium]